MEESGEASTEASGDRGSCWMNRRIRGQLSQHEEVQDLHTLTDERGKALLEYRARCTSARFWIQSELLDLRVGCLSPCADSRGSDAEQISAARAPATDSDKMGSDPGLVGDLPSLMKRHLTCPLLSKLLQQDPVLSGKLATLDHVLWHRRSKHEPQTSGWMSHDPFCPDECSFGGAGTSQGASDVPRRAVTAVGGLSSKGSSRSSTVDSVWGEVSAGAASANSGLPTGSSEPTRAVEDESRPVTVWVSCEQCMEHFAYIAASLLVFLKPSELRDLAVERQQSQCCGFVFCGRRNVATPENRCCNRQQQLLRLLDEEPMYARPGIKEWIGDALQRKAAYRPHPHGASRAGIVDEETSPDVHHEHLKQPRVTGSTSAIDLKEPSERLEKPGPPVEMDVLLSEGLDRLETKRLVGPVLEKPPSCVSFSTDSSSCELTKLGSNAFAEGFRVPITVEEEECSADETPPDLGVYQAEISDGLGSHGPSLSTGNQGREVTNNFLMLNYSSSEINGVSSTTTFTTGCDVSPSAVANGASAAKRESPDKPRTTSSAVRCSSSDGHVETVEAGKLQPQKPQRAGASNSQAVGANCHAEPQFKYRGSRVRFADDDGEEGEEGDIGGESVPTSFFKHFFKMDGEDDGPGFYTRGDRSAASGINTYGSQARNGTGELRSILKPATEPVDPSPSSATVSAEAQVGYMRLSDVVIAFDLLSSCCTDASAKFLSAYHRRFCTCSCEGAVPTAAATSLQQAEGDETPTVTAGIGDCSVRGIRSRNVSEADESDGVSCVDGESGDEIEPSELWRRRQQQLLKAILRSLPPSADGFAPLVTELCETFQPLQPLPTLRCSLCSCLAAVILLLLLLLRARPLTCCCCCESCRPWSNGHKRHSHCQRRQPSGSLCGKAEGLQASDAATSFYFDDALTLAREEDVGLALVDFVRSTIHQSAPCSSPIRPFCGGADMPNAAEAAETSTQNHEERAIHVLLESIFSRMTRPILQMCEASRHSSELPE